MYSLRSSISVLTFLVCVCYGIAEVTTTTGGPSSTNATTTAATSPSAATTNTTTTATTTTATATTATTATTTTTTATTVAITATPPSTTTSTITSSTTITSTSGQGSFPLTTPANLTTQSSTTSSSTSEQTTTAGTKNTLPAHANNSTAESTSHTMESTSSSSISTNAPTTSYTIDSTSSSKDTASSDTILPNTTRLEITPTSEPIASTQPPVDNSTNSNLSTEVVSSTSTITPYTDASSSTSPSADTLPPSSPSDKTTPASTGVTSSPTTTSAQQSISSSTSSTIGSPLTSPTTSTSQYTLTATTIVQSSAISTSTTVVSTGPSSSDQSTATTTSVLLPNSTTSVTASSFSTLTPSSAPPTTVTPTTNAPGIDVCASIPCKNGATCHNLVNNYTCMCASGWEGWNCTSNINECIGQNNCSVFANCVDTEGSYNCSCKDGFDGNGIVCNDTDECASNPCKNGAICNNLPNNYNCTCALGWEGRNCDIDIDECASKPCKNEAKCNNLVNNYNCTCAPGWDGRNCDIDIDECASNPCKNEAKCNNLPNNYNCTCAPGWQGRNCDIDIDECATKPCQNGAKCNNLENNYTCACTPGWQGLNCEIDIDECASNPCKNGAKCNNLPNNYNCTCAPVWEGRNCDIDIDECERKTHTCHKYAVCEDFDGGFNCSCKPGFTGNGSECKDIDECSNNQTCGNGDCVNVPGAYRCFCRAGWNGSNCREDIDECEVRNACSPNANCTNTQGSFTCQCHSDYRADGNDCVLEVLISVPSSLPRRYGDDNVYGPFTIDGGLAYFGRLYSTFYVNVNGFITLGRDLSSTYPPSTSGSWPSIPVIAPLWADVQMGPITDLISFIEISDTITNATVLQAISIAANTSLTHVTKAIAVTWRNAVPYPYSQNFKHETADFQVIIATDNEQTFVMYNYDQKLFNWTKSYGRRVAIGYSMENFQGNVQFDTENFTSANKHSNGGISGRWVFNVTSNAAESKLKCYNAIKDNPIKELEPIRAKAEPCPCSYAQAIRDRRFRYLGFNYTNILIFESRFKQNDLQQRCHYSSIGSLINGHPTGGYVNVLNNTVFQKLRAACCSNPSMECQNLFYQVHPSDTCRRYVPPAWAPSWGDPHIKTLDGAEYTFNGRGEYILVKKDNVFEIQVRTENINNNTDASIFVGLALKNGTSGDILSIVLNTAHQAVIHVNGVYHNAFLTGTTLNISANGFEVHNDNDSNDAIYIDMESQVSLKVAVSDHLDIVVNIPKSIKQTNGLLGNNDDNNTNDYQFSNGTTINSNSTEMQLFEFGSSWQIKNAISLFNGTYNGTHAFDFYNNASIKPSNFVSDNLKNNDTIAAYLNATCPKLDVSTVIIRCGNNKACLVDAMASCDPNFGAKSRQTEEVEEKSAKYLDQKTLIISKTFLATLRNQTITLKFNATDSMNATTEVQPDIYYCGCNKSSQCNFHFILEDGAVADNFYRASCNCSEGVTDQYCDEVVSACDTCFNGTTCNNGKCGACPQGLSGDGQKCFDVDDCYASSPCDQHCYNTLGSFYCSCNSGYELINNTHCRNIDECERRLDNCTVDKICVDTIGSFTCKCKPGYSEDGNGKCSRARTIFGGTLVFQVHSTASPDSIRYSVINYLNASFGLKAATFEIILSNFLEGKRTRRESSNLITMKADFIMNPNNDSVSNAMLEERFNVNLFIPITTGDIIQILANRSKMFSDLDGGACNIPDSNACVTSTTYCVSKNNTLSCKCKSGFEEWEIPYTSCRDKDECQPSNDVCANGKCKNTPGSFSCTCNPGYEYDSSHACRDMCEPNPCQNEGQCVHGELENQYICKCSNFWTGQNCADEDSESKKLRTIAIAVGSVFGAGCLLLLCVVFGMYRRNKAMSGDFYTRRPLSVDFDDDSRYDLRPTSIPLRKQDFPIDDDTSPAFSIPRPAVSTTNAYDPVGQKSAYDLLEEQEATKVAETKPLTEERMLEGEELGKENPSFLHSEASASSKRRASKNPYEYF